MTHPCVDRLIAAIADLSGLRPGIFGTEAELDATVPNWRFTVRGAGSISAELGRWFADPGHFDELERTPTPDGELLAFSLSWEENGVPHSCHQAHRLQIHDDRVVRDTGWCGGRWPASLLAEMEAAGVAG